VACSAGVLVLLLHKPSNSWALLLPSSALHASQWLLRSFALPRLKLEPRLTRSWLSSMPPLLAHLGAVLPLSALPPSHLLSSCELLH